MTVTVSATAATRSSALTVATNVAVNWIPSRRTAVNPGSENVTAYVPGRRSTMRYWPVPSVTTVRLCSIRAGLVASTVTPGRTAPDESRTTPVIEACCAFAAGLRTANNERVTASRVMVAMLPSRMSDAAKTSGQYGSSMHERLAGSGSNSFARQGRHAAGLPKSWNDSRFSSRLRADRPAARPTFVGFPDPRRGGTPGTWFARLQARRR